jgi:hypothetical protein
VLGLPTPSDHDLTLPTQDSATPLEAQGSELRASSFPKLSRAAPVGERGQFLTLPLLTHSLLHFFLHSFRKLDGGRLPLGAGDGQFSKLTKGDIV